jgi:dienelactone hydrolase
VDPRFVAAYLAGTALLLAGSALATGPLAAFLASPLSLALLAVAAGAARRLTPRTPRGVVAVGALAAASGVGLALAGPTGAGLATAVAGAGAVLCGAQLALLFDPPPPGQALPSRLGAHLNLGVAADEALKLYWELVALAQPRGDLARIAAEVRQAAERNAERGWLAQPELAHPIPPTLEKPLVVSRSVRGAGPLEHLSFASEYEPHDPEIHAQYLAAERNRTAHVYLWRHRDGPRPTLLCLHGYGMGRIGLDARAFEIRRLHDELGLDVAAVVLPLHGPRSILRRSGAGFLDGHPLWTNAAFTQAVWDLRRLCGWLRAQGAPALGIYGMSLGGYTAALFASLEPGLACAVPIIPVSSLARLTWRQMNPVQRNAALAAGLDEELFERAWHTHSPLHLVPKPPLEARLVVGALADRIVPPEQPHALWEHWGRPAVHWFPGTHLAWVGWGETRARIEAHLRATLLAGAERPRLSRFRRELV